jgi:hypothetical protein
MTNKQRAAMHEAENAGSLHQPSSADIEGTLSRLGLLHKAQNDAEQHLEYISSFLPAAAAGPEGLVSNVVKRGVLPGVASDALGTVGDAVDPSLGVVGRVAGALVSPGAPKAPLPRTEDLRAAADQGYTAARQMQVAVDPAHTSGWAGGTAVQLTRDGMTDKLAPQTHAVLQELRATPQNGAVSLDNLETVRRTLGKIAGTYSNPTDAEAATRALNGLDDMVSGLQPHNVLSGNAQDAAKAWATARANYAAMKRAEAVSNLAYNAQLNTDAAVRQDIGNATRQQFKKLLTSDKTGRGFNDAELAQAERIVRGTPSGNTLRTISNALGGGGGLAQGLAMAAGGYAGSQGGGAEGAVGGALVPLVLGALARRGANTSVLRQVGKLDEMVRARSPLAQEMANQLATSRPQQRLLTSADRILKIARAAALANRYTLGQAYSPSPVMAGGDAVK